MHITNELTYSQFGQKTRKHRLGDLKFDSCIFVNKAQKCLLSK